MSLKGLLLVLMIAIGMTSPAMGGCSCRGGGGGGSYDFLSDPAFSGMLNDFESMMSGALTSGGSADASQQGVLIGAVQSKEAVDTPKNVPVDTAKSSRQPPSWRAADDQQTQPADVRGRWALVMLGESSRDVDLSLSSVGFTVFGRGFSQEEPFSASGTLTGSRLTLDLVSQKRPLMYRLDMQVAGENISGSYEEFMPDGSSRSGTVTGEMAL